MVTMTRQNYQMLAAFRPLDSDPGMDRRAQVITLVAQSQEQALWLVTMFVGVRCSLTLLYLLWLYLPHGKREETPIANRQFSISDLNEP